MPRLVDADALSARMYHDAFETDSDMQKWDSGCWIRYKMFENAIADAPTVDAVPTDFHDKCMELEIKKRIDLELNSEPVRHGHWIWMGEQGDSRYMCSVCKGKEDNVPTCNGEPTIWEYCPNCGTKMDEVKDGKTD